MITVGRKIAGALAVAALAGIGACSGGNGDSDTTASSTAEATSTAMPTDAGSSGTDASSGVDDAEAQVLVATLLVQEDMGASWGPPIEPGVIPEEAQPFTSGVPVECANPSDDLRQPVWQVQTMFMPTEAVVAGIDGSEGLALSERVFAGTVDDATQIFAALRTALGACAGETSEDSPDGGGWVQLVTVTDLPGIGDEALLLWMGNAGVGEPGDASVSTARAVVARTGGHLTYVALIESVHVAEFTGDWPAPAIADAEFDAIVATAVTKVG